MTTTDWGNVPIRELCEITIDTEFHNISNDAKPGLIRVFAGYRGFFMGRVGVSYLDIDFGEDIGRFTVPAHFINRV